MFVISRLVSHHLAWFGGVALALAAVPSLIAIIGGGTFWITLLFQVFVWVTLAVSWNLFSGYSGYASFGHGAFWGVGMYTTAVFLIHTTVPFLLMLPVAGLMTALLSLVVGGIIFRLSQFRGELFSLLTLAMTFIIATIVNNVDWIDGGGGVFFRDTEAAKFAASSTVGLYYVSLLIVLTCVYTAYAIYHSRWGHALFALRDDEDVADGLGIPTFRYKLYTFAISAFFAGLIGGTQALFLGYLETTTVFSVMTPLLVLMMVIFGGTFVWYGPIIGAVIITLLRQTFTGGETAVLNQILIGMVLIVVILLMPQGLGGMIENWRIRAKREQS